MKQLKSVSKKELVKVIEKHVVLFDALGTYFKGKARFAKLDDEERQIRAACLQASKDAGRLPRCEESDVCLTPNAAVLIWDHLNETALNIKQGGFRRAILKSRKRLEKAMKEAGLGVPKSDNGRAE